MIAKCHLAIFAVCLLLQSGCQWNNYSRRFPEVTARQSRPEHLAAGNHDAIAFQSNGASESSIHQRANVRTNEFNSSLVHLATPERKTTARVDFQELSNDAAYFADNSARQIPSVSRSGDRGQEVSFHRNDQTGPGQEMNLPDMMAGPLELDNVIQAVLVHYPEIDIALAEIAEAQGKFQSSQGSFDRVLSGQGITQPVGFYETHRFGVGVNQPLFGGGEFFGGYRIGDGNFEPWYGERETNEGGEFKAGFSLPLLKNRQIDQRRAQLFGADFMIDRAQSDMDSRVLLIRRIATQVYWEWVASGAAVQIQNQLLKLAESRVNQINLRVEKGDLAEIAKIDNDRFIAKRKNDLIKARRLLEKSAIKLSIFWRDREGVPVIAQASEIPSSFPQAFRIGDEELANSIVQALDVRPEFDLLNAERQKTLVDLDYANNLTLPKLDLKALAGQDIGGLTSKKGDKQPLEVQVGVLASVPLQRREALGKIQQAQAKLSQIEAKIRLTGDKIRIEVQDAASAVNAAYDQITQSLKNVELTRKALNLGKEAFEKGDIDLIALNIYETSVATAQLQLLDARLKFFTYQAIYENAIRANGYGEEK